MLREIHIKNFSIIDDTTIEFGEGFNVLTGETGAGKSIIINALSLALGERATGEFIRSGEKEAIIEAYFDVSPELLNPSTQQFLEDSGIEYDEGLILKRIISARGKNRAYINNSMASVQTLAEISKTLADIHGQYEHQSLLLSDNQLDLLDAYGGLLNERQEIASIYESLLKLKRQINELAQQEKDRAQRLDILEYQIREIEAADLRPGEEEELLKEAKILSNAHRLAELVNQSYTSLYLSDSSCIAEVSKILNNLREISSIDHHACDALKAVEDALPLLEEVSYFLRDYKESLDFNPDRLEQIQDRLDLIKGLKRKYGSDIQEVLDFMERARYELENLQHSEEKLEELKNELSELRKKFTEKANLLSKRRREVAKKIESEVVIQLSALSMPDTRFLIQINQEEGDDTTEWFKATYKGIDRVEFLISPNVGEDLKPLSKIASGGELSRIMLALKGILARGDNIPVLVFDEIDSGIGGKTAETIARKLKELSMTHQVICITHLPQIASYADVHLRIEKKIEKGRTVVEIDRVEKDKRVKEIARMLSGETSDVSIKHAKEMLKKAHK
jgi:DNA repair protein RecN (Recombination protein N)